jgi:hypothetical protein
MSYPKPPEKIVAFNSGAVAPHDIGRQFDEHRRAVGNVIEFLRTVVRDDGVVRNGSVGPEQLSAELPETLAKQATSAVESLLAHVRQSAAVVTEHMDDAKRLRDEIGALKIQMSQNVEALRRASEMVTQMSSEVQLRLAELENQAAARSTALATGTLGPNAGGFYGVDALGAASTAQDYAQVSIEWAEHMPDTIPPNILAINAITGAHWSSRWWANRTAGLLAGFGAIGSIPGSQGVFAEAVTVTALNVCADLSKTPTGPVLLVVNGAAFLPVGTLPPFIMSGKTIEWFSSIYSLIPGQTDVAAWYPYAP